METHLRARERLNSTYCGHGYANVRLEAFPLDGTGVGYFSAGLERLGGWEVGRLRPV